jgi:hypothetical protein
LGDVDARGRWKWRRLGVGALRPGTALEKLQNGIWDEPGLRREHVPITIPALVSEKKRSG